MSFRRFSALTRGVTSSFILSTVVACGATDNDPSMVEMADIAEATEATAPTNPGGRPPKDLECILDETIHIDRRLLGPVSFTVSAICGKQVVSPRLLIWAPPPIGVTMSETRVTRTTHYLGIATLHNTVTVDITVTNRSATTFDLAVMSTTAAPAVAITRISVAAEPAVPDHIGIPIPDSPSTANDDETQGEDTAPAAAPDRSAATDFSPV